MPFTIAASAPMTSASVMSTRRRVPPFVTRAENFGVPLVATAISALLGAGAASVTFRTWVTPPACAAAGATSAITSKRRVAARRALFGFLEVIIPVAQDARPATNLDGGPGVGRLLGDDFAGWGAPGVGARGCQRGAGEPCWPKSWLGFWSLG